jgi:uncharacterized small protein (DUF1192 family)
MSEEPAEPTATRGAALGQLEREDLDLYAVEELKERIERLRAEISRVEAKLEKKQSGRSAADALFKF